MAASVGLFSVQAAGLTKLLTVFIVVLWQVENCNPFNKTLDDAWRQTGEEKNKGREENNMKGSLAALKH